MLDSFFYWVGTAYRDTAYVSGLKIAGILCSYADIFVAAILLRITDVIRERAPSKFRYGVLIVFAVITPTLLLPKEGLDFFILQFIVLAPPYLILMYTAFTEARFFMAYVKDKIFSRQQKSRL
ncbi:MAG: hypothetical protein FWE49_05925 [Synergistaceae bacterium]|nr:hypothetical protein [Synergistaceae bacterium]